MRLALNGATIMRSPVERDVEIAAEAGFDALEVWAGKLDGIDESGVRALASRMRERRLAASCVNSIEDITFRRGDGRRQLFEQLEQLCDHARVLGAPAIVVVPGLTPAGAAEGEIHGDSVSVLREMADRAGDIALAFEFLGKPGCCVVDLATATAIVAEVDRPNVGLVIDTFHFYAGGSNIEDIDGVPMEKLLVVHLNGSDELPPGELTDAHRRYPGEGPIPIDAIVGALRRRGYDGTFSVEIFRPEYWEQEPREVAVRAHAAAVEVLRRNGYGAAA